MAITLLNKQRAADLLGVKPRTLLHYRETNQFIEGVHYFRINEKNIKYVKETLEHWVISRSNPEIHQRYCQDFIQSTESTVERSAS